MSAKRRAALAGVALALIVAALWWWRGDERASRPREAAAAREARAEDGDDAARRARIARHRAAVPPRVEARRTLRGIVVDAAGAPVGDAQVVLARPARVARAGADGRFTLTDLPPARVAVEAHDAQRIAGPLPVDLTDGDAEVTLRLYQGHALEVMVVAEDDGRAIEGALVRAQAITMFDGAHLRAAFTDGAGVARLPGLVYVGHELIVSAPGYAVVRRGPGPDQEEPAPHVRALRVALPAAAAALDGRVVDEAGAPVAGAEVEVVPYQEGLVAVDDARRAARLGAADPHLALRSGLGVRTDDDGRFELGVARGTWIVIATADGLAPAVSEPVFAEGGARATLQLVAARGRTVRGVVVTSDDRPVAGATVQARWLDGDHVLGDVRADATGEFALRGLPAAPIVLVASSDVARARPVKLDLTAADPAPVIVTLALDGAITGRVTDERGAGIADAIVTFVERRPGAPAVFPGVVVTDAEGRFAVRGLPARTGFHLSAARPQDGGFAQHAVGRVAEAGDEVTLVVPSPGAIVGRVDVTGDPGRLVVRDLQTLTAARVGRDGRFRLDGLPPLTYQLRLGGPRAATVYRDGVEVRPGETTDVGTIAVPAGRAVSGVVVDPAGEPLDEATIRIEVDGRYAVVTRSHRGAFDATVPDGAALVVHASHPRAGRCAPRALAAGAATTRLRLETLPGVTVRGEVRAHGRPLPDARLAVWPAGDRGAEPWAAAVSDDAGRFELAGVPPGAWHVELLVDTDDALMRVLRQPVEIAGADAPPPVVFDASDVPAGTVVVPPSDVPDLPTHGDEGGEHEEP